MAARELPWNDADSKCRFLGIDSYDLKHYSNGCNCLKKRSRAPSDGITCKLPVVRFRRETQDSSIRYSSTPRHSVYFARAGNDGAGAKGVTRATREIIGNCMIVHRELIVEFRESTGQYVHGQIETSEECNSLLSSCMNINRRSRSYTSSAFRFSQLNWTIKGQRRIIACQYAKCFWNFRDYIYTMKRVKVSSICSSLKLI